MINFGVPIESLPTLDTLRKILSEYLTKNDIPGHWYDQVMAVACSYRTILSSEHGLAGYVQNFEGCNGLEISCYCEKQFECLARTPFNDRVLHIDATGSIVTINNKSKQQYASYKRILNYFLLLKNDKIQDISCSKIQIGNFLN